MQANRVPALIVSAALLTLIVQPIPSSAAEKNGEANSIHQLLTARRDTHRQLVAALTASGPSDSYLSG